MSNNNPLTEIGAIILAAVLIIVAGLLVYVGKFSTADAGIAFTLAVGLFAGNLALKAPSPTQQAALLQLTTQALQAQALPAPTVSEELQALHTAVQALQTQAHAAAPSQFVQPLGINSMTAAAQPGTMPQAMQTTQVYPAAPRQ